MSKIRFSELEKTLNYSGLEECDGQSKCAIDGIVKTRFEKAENSENLEIQNKSIKIIKSPNLELKQFMDSILSNLDDINYIKNFIARFDLNKEYYSKFSPNLYLLKCSPRRLQEEIRSAEIAKYQLFELSNILETEEVDTSQIEHKLIEVLAPLQLIKFSDVYDEFKNIRQELNAISLSLENDNPKEVEIFNKIISKKELSKDFEGVYITSLPFFKNIFFASYVFFKQQKADKLNDLKTLQKLDFNILELCAVLIQEERVEEACKFFSFLRSPDCTSKVILQLINSNNLKEAHFYARYLPISEIRRFIFLKLSILFYQRDRFSDALELFSEVVDEKDNEKLMHFIAKGQNLGLNLVEEIQRMGFSSLQRENRHLIYQLLKRHTNAVIDFVCSSDFLNLVLDIDDDFIRDEMLYEIVGRIATEKDESFKNISSELFHKITNTPNNNFFYRMLGLELLVVNEIGLSDPERNYYIDLLLSSKFNYKKNLPDSYLDDLKSNCCNFLIRSKIPTAARIAFQINNQYNLEKIINSLICEKYFDEALFLLKNLQHLESKNMILLTITNKFLSSEDIKKAIEAASLIITKDHVIAFNNRNERSEAFFSIYKKLISKNIYEVAVDISKRELLMCASFSRKEEIKILNFVFCKEELSEWGTHLNLTIIFTELYRLASFDRKAALREPIFEIIVQGIKQKDDIYNILAKLFSNFLDKNILEPEDLICIDFLENMSKSNRLDLPVEYDYLCFNWSNYFLDNLNPHEALKCAKKIRAEAFERFKIVKFPTTLYIDLYKKISEQIPLKNEDKISRDDDYTILSEVCEIFLKENNIVKAREIASYVGVGIKGPFPFAIANIKKRIFDLVESYKITS